LAAGQGAATLAATKMKATETDHKQKSRMGHRSGWHHPISRKRDSLSRAVEAWEESANLLTVLQAEITEARAQPPSIGTF
jgi:hypothetical protein